MNNETLQTELKKQKQFSKTITILIFCLLTSFVGFLIGLKIGTPKDNYAYVSKVLNILEKEWYSEIYYPNTEDAPIAQFISSVANFDTKKQLDPYTYLIKRQPGVSDESGKLGIKVQNLFNSNFQLVKVVYPNSPAKKAGLEVYDLIYGVELDDQTIHYDNYNQYLKGEVGNQVTLLVYRTSTQQHLKISISYGKYQYPTAYTIFSDINEMLYVKLDGFVSDITGFNTVDELEDILKNNQDVKYLTIDLINNGGGSLDSLVEICDLFLPAKKLVSTIETKNKNQTQYKTKNKTAYDFEHVFILMNENTASASEMLIGCLTNHLPNLTVIGTNTYGKGIAQRTINLTKDYDFQYTFAKWFTPDNEWIHTVGFAPTSEADLIKRTDLYQSFLTTRFDSNLNLQIDTVDTYNIKNLQILLNQLDQSGTLNLREDGYFDENLKNAILKIQQENNLLETGVVNTQTLLPLAILYSDEVINFENQYSNRIQSIIKEG